MTLKSLIVIISATMLMFFIEPSIRALLGLKHLSRVRFSRTIEANYLSEAIILRASGNDLKYHDPAKILELKDLSKNEIIGRIFTLNPNVKKILFFSSEKTLTNDAKLADEIQRTLDIKDVVVVY